MASGRATYDARDTAYEASPACRERQCSITYEPLITSFAVAYQHGPNPESVLIVDAVVSAASGEDAAANVRRAFREFAERCHRYEDGILAAHDDFPTGGA